MTKMGRNDLGTKWPGYEMTGYRAKSLFSASQIAQNFFCDCIDLFVWSEFQLLYLLGLFQQM